MGKGLKRLAGIVSLAALSLGGCASARLEKEGSLFPDSDLADFLGDFDGNTTPEEMESLKNRVENSPDGYLWSQLSSGMSSLKNKRLIQALRDYNSGKHDALLSYSPDPVKSSYEESARGPTRSSSGVIKINPVTNRIVGVYSTCDKAKFVEIE